MLLLCFLFVFGFAYKIKYVLTKVQNSNRIRWNFVFDFKKLFIVQDQSNVGTFT